MKVAQLMTREVACCSPDETLAAAAEQMWRRDCGVLPVCDPGSHRVVGMITDRDICMSTWMNGSAPQSLRVGASMSRSLEVCSPDDSIEQAARSMRDARIRRLPVVNKQGGLIGILSLADIVREAEREKPRRERERDVPSSEVTTTLANICRPGDSTELH